MVFPRALDDTRMVGEVWKHTSHISSGWVPTAVESQTEKIPLSLIHLSALPKITKRQTKNSKPIVAGRRCRRLTVELLHAL
jgi:hypothetical protein